MTARAGASAAGPAPATVPAPVAGAAKRERLGRALQAVLSAAAVGALGAHVFFGPGFGPVLTFGAIAGIVAALTCTELPDAAASAALGAVGGFALAQLVYATRWSAPSAWLGSALATAAVAGGVAAAIAWLVGRSGRLGSLFAALAVLALIGASAMSVLASASSPQPAEWVTNQPGSSLPLTQALTVPTTQTAASPDDTLFLNVVQRVAAGQPYYPTFVSALADDNRVHADGAVPLDSSTSYRLPTLYWSLAHLPQDGVSFVLAAIGLLAIGVVAAYGLARRFVSVAVALEGAAAVAGYAAQLAAWPSILFTEFWAGMLALVAVALFVRSRAASRGATALQVAAVAAALLAALTRELAAAFLVAGLVASIADTPLRRTRAWIVWLVGLSAAFVAYAMHARLALTAFAASGAPAGLAQGVSRVPWFHPDGKGLLAAVALGASAFHWSGAAMFVLLAIGVVGALAVRAERGTRIMLGLTGCAGVLVLALVRAAGTYVGGASLGYWGMVVIPTALACVPLAFSRLPGVSADEVRLSADSPAPQLPAEKPAPV